MDKNKVPKIIYVDYGYRQIVFRKFIRLSSLITTDLRSPNIVFMIESVKDPTVDDWGIMHMNVEVFSKIAPMIEDFFKSCSSKKEIKKAANDLIEKLCTGGN